MTDGPVRLTLSCEDKLYIDREALKNRPDVTLVRLSERPEAILFPWNAEPVMLPLSTKVIGRNTSAPFKHDCVGVHKVRTCDVDQMQLWQVSAVAELAIGALLTLSRQLLRAATCDVTHYDRDRFLAPKSLSDMRVLIYGTGRIATHILQRLTPWGCQVKMGTERDELLPLVRYSDAVFVSMPPREDGRPVFDCAEIGSLPKDAFLIDISNEGVLNVEYALWLLSLNSFAGLACDSAPVKVARRGDDWRGLTEAGRLLLTPHIGGSTVSARARTEMLVVNEMVERVKKIRRRD